MSLHKDIPQRRYQKCTNMTNPAYRAMLRGKESDASGEEVWEEVKKTTAQKEWDVEQMLGDDSEENQPQRASDD